MPTTIYVEEDDARAHLDKQKINHDDQILRVIEGATDIIDWYTGREFRKHADQAREHFISPDGIIYVVDLIAATNDDVTITIDTDNDLTFSQSLGSDSFVLEPRTTSTGVPSTRYQRVAALVTGDDAYHLKPGYRTKLDGTWGYYETDDDDNVLAPSAIQYACLLLVARWYKRRDTPLQVSQMPGYGFHRVIAEDKDAMAILRDFRHPLRQQFIR
jgi:hypothetical protein